MTTNKMHGFIAADDNDVVFGAGTTRAECEADARDYRDDDIDGLTFYAATAAALDAVAKDGADASRALVFGHNECWHESESDQ